MFFVMFTQMEFCVCVKHDLHLKRATRKLNGPCSLGHSLMDLMRATRDTTGQHAVAQIGGDSTGGVCEEHSKNPNLKLPVCAVQVNGVYVFIAVGATRPS